jgi:hypothetical protein
MLALLFLAQFHTMHLSYGHEYLHRHALRWYILGAIAALAAGVPVVALWGLHRAAEAIRPDDAVAPERFCRVWQLQNGFLAVLGMELSLGVLTTAAKFAANNAYVTPQGTKLVEVPITYVLVQGSIYGAIMLAVYLPPYFGIRHVGERLIDELVRSRAVDAASRDWLAEREEAERWRSALGLSETPVDQIRRSAFLLAPLLAALVSSLLPDLKL